MNIYDDENHWNVITVKYCIADTMFELLQNKFVLEICKKVLFHLKKHLDDTCSFIISIEERIEELSKIRKYRKTEM